MRSSIKAPWLARCLSQLHIKPSNTYLTFHTHTHTHTFAVEMVLSQYDYIFAIGTLFAMLDAYNNGASMSISL